MGSSKRNLLTSILLLVVMGVFAVLTIFIVVDAINKKYYNDIKVEYEVQEESPNVILTFARNEGSNFSTDNTKVMLNEDKTKFRIDGTVPTIENGVVTNLDELTSNDGREFYFFSTNSSFIGPQEDPENPDFIFSDTDSRYYVSTEDNPIWYDVPKSSENLTLYSVFLTPNVHNSDFANAPLLNTSPNVIISNDVVDIPYNAFSNALMESDLSMTAKIESIVIPNSTKSIDSGLDMDLSNGSTGSGAFAGCTTLTNIIIPGSVEEIGGEAFMLCSGLDTVEYGNGYYLQTENNEHAVLVGTNLKADNVTIHEDCISIQGGTFSKYYFIALGFIPPPDMGDDSNTEEILGNYINANLQEITIPKNVKNIGFAAFMSCIGLTNVEFEVDSNLTSIGAMSFAGCSSLKTINLEATKLEEIWAFAFGFIEEDIIPSAVIEEITLPNTLRTIGMGAFVNCTSLRTVNFENNSQLTSIGERAFYNCSSLTSITIPDNVTSIEDYAFGGCGSLEEVTFGENSQLTNIGKLTFALCENLITITVPKSVTSIGDYAFSNCYKLVEVYDLTGPNGLNITAGSGDNGGVGYYALEIKKEKELTGIYYTGTNNEYVMYEDLNGNHYLVDYQGQGGDITLPTFGYTRTYSIKSYAFYGEDKLTSITIPDGVTSIGDSAFYSCGNITSIIIPKSVTSIGDDAFRYCNNIQELRIDDLTSYLNISYGDYDYSRPLYSTDQAVNLYVGEELITNLEIPDGVTAIPDYAFRHVSNITSVTISESVTSIGRSTFSYCSSLTSVNFGDNSMLTSIGEYAFYECSSLETVNFGDNSMLTSIGSYAFYDCSNLTSVNFEDNSQLTSIGNNAFNNCSSLTSITIPDSVTSIGSLAFYYCDSLTSITIPESVTSIGDYAFNNCTGLTSITFEDMTGLTSIDTYIFDDCDNVKQLTIQSGDVKDLNFYRLSNLTTVTLGDGVTSIGDSAFKDCSSLETVNFGENPQLASIENYAFSACSSLKTVTFGDNSQLASIGNYAFYYCSSLTSITIPESVTSIGSYAFRSCSKLTIYCEASSQPSGWDSRWNYSNRPVYWAGEWKMVDGVPVPIESGVEGVGLSEIGEDFGIGFDGLGFREELYFNDKRERKVV